MLGNVLGKNNLLNSYNKADISQGTLEETGSKVEYFPQEQIGSK